MRIGYSTQMVYNAVARALQEGRSTDEIKKTFLSMRMANALEGVKNRKLVPTSGTSERYMDDWEAILKTASKRIKTCNMAKLAIKAIFTNSTKEYPNLKFEFVEQARRIRIKVKMPGSRLATVIDAWYGSYKEKLPPQIEKLKILLNAFEKAGKMEFFIPSH